MKFTKKIIFYSFFFTLLLIVVVYIFITYKKPASHEGIIRAYTDSEIVIKRDKSGIPFVKTDNFNDAYFSIGFLHGLDRLALAEYYRAVAIGRLSEITGAEGLVMDKIALTIGFLRQAESIIVKLDGPFLDYLNYYVKGINRAKDLGQEKNGFAGLSPKVWTIKDVVAILLLFEWSDAYFNNRELVFPVLQENISRPLKDIIPDNLLFYYYGEDKSSLDLLFKIREQLWKYAGRYTEGFAFYIHGGHFSNNRSVSGFTLDGDMNIFPRWYPVNITIDSNNINGITATGLPFILFGRNKDISFSGFNLKLDSQDFRIEKIRTNKEVLQYFRNGSWKNFTELRVPLYAGDINDSDKVLTLSVRITDTGPVISDIDNNPDIRQCVSLNSVFPDYTYIYSLFNIVQSESPEQAVDNVRNIFSLPKLYLFCVNDYYLYAYSGKLYLQKDRSVFNMSYDSGPVYMYDISGYKGINKNNAVIGDMIFEDLPGFARDYIIRKDNDRYDRIKTLFGEKILQEPKDITSALNDNYSQSAEKYISLFLPILEQIPLPSSKLCRIYFNDWDYKMDSESVAATLYNTILIFLINETLGDEMDEGFPLKQNYHLLTDEFYKLMFEGTSLLFDDITTKNNIETRDTIFYRAFIKTLRFLNKQMGPIMEDWKWGNLHKGHFNIPMYKKSFWKEGLVKLSDVEVPGGNSTVLKGSVNSIDLLKPLTVSLLSGIYYLDLNLSSLSISFSQTIDTESDYYRDYSMQSDFVNINIPEVIHELKILPQNN